MDPDDQVKALLPQLINGKTHQQLREDSEAFDKMAGNHHVYGIKFPWVVRQANLDALKTFEVRADDVFLFSYPRSGNGWSAGWIEPWSYSS